MNAPLKAATSSPPRLDGAKFQDWRTTLEGQQRASVPFDRLATLWINTGTLCNLTCANCYIESSPTNDRLAYLSADEAAVYLDEIAALGWDTTEIGFTGGEPFMNPDIVEMLSDALDRGARVLVLTNAMTPMRRHKAALTELRRAHGDRLVIRVSVDHYAKALHELERGRDTWERMLEGLEWLCREGFAVNVAGRTCWSEPEARMRAGYADMFARHGIDLDAQDPVSLLLFPEMDDTLDVPEISVGCWDKLGIAPAAMMCATSRMVVKRRGADTPVVLPCTLLPYDARFEMGARLADAAGDVALNHPHCARFCVLGGGSCSKA